MKRYIEIMAVAVPVLFLFTACETLSVDEKVVSAPVIQSFSPKKAPAGSDIVVTGEFLNNVTKAYIGDVEVEISEKVSDKRLSIRVGEDVSKGRISLENLEGTGFSEEEFESSLAVPAINGDFLQESAGLGEEILIQGTDLNSVVEVLFMSDGYEGHAAEIIQQQDAEIVVKVPYVETSQAKIILTYYDGGQEPVSTPIENAPTIEIIKAVPSFDSMIPERTAVGKSITLSGKNLNLVERITVRENGVEGAPEFEAAFNATEESLTFTVPAGNYDDGDHTVTVRAEWYDGNEGDDIMENLVIYVPFVKFWENITAYCQGRTETNSYRSFFSPETGILYENSRWRDELDPIAYRLNGANWGGTGSNNVPVAGVVSDEDYDSTVPYFFFSAVNDGPVQINSPANSNGQLKNFFMNGSSSAEENRITGTSDNIHSGIPILAFRYLNPDNQTEAALINKVKNAEIENIDEVAFPVNTMDMTVAGIGISTVSGSINTDTWCGSYEREPMRDTPDYEVGAVILVMYYHNGGYSKENPALNIKRIGLLHIKTMDWGTYSTSSRTTYANSNITFDCYWQKYDYDYNKVQ